MIGPVEYVPLGMKQKMPRVVWLAPLSIVLGSLVTLLPLVASVPFLPPFGLMMWLGWRMLRPDAMRVWAPVPLGFFDDLVSGQPLGSAMLLWTLCGVMLDVIDTRLVWRDFWQDWLIASGAISFCLIAGRLVAAPLAAHVDMAILLFPIVSRLCAWLGRDSKAA